MLKKAQIEAVPFVFGIIGAILAYIMANSMGNGLIMKIIITLLTGIVCYFLTLFILNQ